MWKEDDGMMGVYASLEDDNGLFPRACPVCGERHAHVLMHKSGLSDGFGTIWVWCDSCGSYAHFSAIIPQWWANPEFVDEGCMDSFVDYPNSLSGPIDDWVNGLIH